MSALVVASLGAMAWLYLLAGRGGFWRAAERDLPETQAPAEGWPRVTAVIPARNEADGIAATLESLLGQDYPGAFSVIVVDDHSSDDTAAIAHRVAGGDTPSRITVLAAPVLAPGWSGKLWALHHGIGHEQRAAHPAAYLLLTDADIRHAPDALRTLVSGACRDRLLLTSSMAKLRAQSFAERALIPAFVFFFQMLYPFAWVNRPERKTAAAAGGCMLLHRESLHAAGGLAAIRGELIDDCALARLIKPHGPIRIGLTNRVESTRAYRSFDELRRMVSRTAFTELRHSVPRLALAGAAMSVAFIAPPFFALSSEPALRATGLFTWACMALAFQPMLRFYRLSPWWGLALPAIAATYLLLTLDSAWQHLRGRGGEWKGRIGPRAASPAAEPALRGAAAMASRRMRR